MSFFTKASIKTIYVYFQLFIPQQKRKVDDSRSGKSPCDRVAYTIIRTKGAKVDH